jgi:hypothetical protein
MQGATLRVGNTDWELLIDFVRDSRKYVRIVIAALCSAPPSFHILTHGLAPSTRFYRVLWKISRRERRKAAKGMYFPFLRGSPCQRSLASAEEIPVTLAAQVCLFWLPYFHSVFQNKQTDIS